MNIIRIPVRHDLDVLNVELQTLASSASVLVLVPFLHDEGVALPVAFTRIICP